MDEKRFILLRRQCERNRKSVCISNDMVRNRSQFVTNNLIKERGDSLYKSFLSSIPVKKSIVRQRGLQVCMKQKRENSYNSTDTSDSQCFGQYDGASVHSYARDIDQYIASRHPKLRRLKRTKKLLEEGQENGAIVSEDALKQKMKEYFEKLKIFTEEADDKVHHIKRTRGSRRRKFRDFLPSLSQSHMSVDAIDIRYDSKPNNRRSIEDQKQYSSTFLPHINLKAVVEQ